MQQSHKISQLIMEEQSIAVLGTRFLLKDAISPTTLHRTKEEQSSMSMETTAHSHKTKQNLVEQCTVVMQTTATSHKTPQSMEEQYTKVTQTTAHSQKTPQPMRAEQ